MESVLNLIVNAENVRMLVILAFCFSGFVLIKSQMKEMGHSIKELNVTLNGRIDELRGDMNGRIDELRGDMNGRIDELRGDMNGRIDELRGDMNGQIDELKHNDIAHLNSAIEALTYALEKNGSFKHEDKEYVDSRLAH